MLFYFAVFSQHHPYSLDLANINKTIFSSLSIKGKHVSCKYSPENTRNVTSMELFKTVLKLQPWASVFPIPVSVLCSFLWCFTWNGELGLGLLVSITSKRIINRPDAYTARKWICTPKHGSVVWLWHDPCLCVPDLCTRNLFCTQAGLSWHNLFSTQLITC